MISELDSSDLSGCSSLERDFILRWSTLKDAPQLVREHRFATGRRWRFDFAHPESRAAIEIEGGVWTGGRHTRGSGFVADCEKYNRAALAGWTVFRLTAGQVKNMATLEAISGMIRSRSIKGASL